MLSKILNREIHIPMRPGSIGGRKRKVITPLGVLASVHDHPAAMRYLLRRNISPEVATQYGLGVCVQVGHAWQGRVVIPMREWWGATAGHIGRAVDGREPKYLSTVPPGTVIGWMANERTAPYVVVEGPFDGLVAHRAGAHVVVLGGVGGRSEVLRGWASRVLFRDPSPELVVCLDGDAPGQRQTQRIAEVLAQVAGAGRVHVVTLPATLDPAEVQPEVFRKLLVHTLSQGRQDVHAG